MSLAADNENVNISASVLIVTAVLAVSLPAPSFIAQAPKAQSHPAVVAPEDRVDINTASIDQLMKVQGMTRTWAARIIRFRPYRAKNDLIDKGVVTSEVYNRIKGHIIAHRQGQ